MTTKSLNVGIVTTWFERGAGYVSRQFKEIIEQEHNVFVYARGGEYPRGNPVWDTEDVHWGKRNPIATTAVDLHDFSKWLDRKNIDVVLFNEQKWWDPILLCNKKGILNGAYMDYYTEETIPIFGLHDFLICNTKKHFCAFDWHPGAHYVPWGTDTELFSPDNSRRYVAQTQPDLLRSLEGKTVFFQSVGVVPFRKGADLLINAFGEVHDSRAHLVIHSQVPLREALPQCEDSINRLQSEKRLTLVEDTVSAPGLYALADVYVYPSRLEGIGLTVPEALSCGLPTIVPDDGPMNEFVSNESGITVRPEKHFCRSDAYYWPQNEVEPRKLAAAMTYYLESPERLREAKAAARQQALAALDWKSNASSILTILSNVRRRNDADKQIAVQKAERYNKRRKVWLKEFIRRVPLVRKIL